MKRKIILISAVVLILVAIIAGYIGYGYYQKIYGDNIKIESENYYLYIPTGSSYEDVLVIMEENQVVNDIESFDWVAKQKGYDINIKPGRYHITKDITSNNDLINLLRSGNQSPVMVKFNNVRKIEQLAGKASIYIEADSATILNALIDPEVYGKYGFEQETFLTMFIPNTYEFYWNTSAEEFIQRMAEEYKKFWTDGRKKQAADMGLSQSQVSILASIVQEEQSQFPDERPAIAGLYFNRLQKGMLLQADPTLKFAWNDFSIRRVLNKHKEIDSPYNTYKNTGLPPGPICLPEISSLNAVLNYEHHEYLYMCAKDDFSGYHNFAKTYRQHLVNAKKYQDELNNRGIR